MLKIRLTLFWTEALWCVEPSRTFQNFLTAIYHEKWSSEQGCALYKAKYSLGKYWKDSNHLDEGVWVPDGPAVVGVEDGHVVGQNGDLQDTAKLVLGLLTGDPVNAEPVQKLLDW